MNRRNLLRTAVGLGTVAGATMLSRKSQATLTLPPATLEITPLTLVVPESELDDLKVRLDLSRFPDEGTVDDWSQGAPLSRVRALVDHWRDKYDWRRIETKLNELGQYRTAIDGLGIHFLHVRSPHPDALPLLLTHGWPGSVIEFLKVIGPLTDPTQYGGNAGDAFHVVIPSMPGYGLSDKPTETGWGLPRIAQAWDTLMKRLGYDRYVAQGGDFGAGVTTHLGKLRPAGLAAIHLNLPILFPPPLAEGEPTAEEQAAIAQLINYDAQLSGYAKEQTTRPQTIGYGLDDSPIGLAAWMYEKFGEWTDSDHDPEAVLSRDEMLDNIMLYWLPGNAASAARLYWESFADEFVRTDLDLPVGVSLFPGELFHPPKVWATRTYSGLFYWNEVERGGHFAAFEQPEIFVRELRDCFRQLRQA